MYHSFDTELAVEYGLAEAIILNNMRFWIEKNEANKENYFDGCYWTYNSIKAYSLMFPYLSEKAIRLALKNLIDKGLIKTGNYNKSAFDRTLWYAFTQKGKSIFPKRQMDFSEKENGFTQKGEPIPDINHIRKPDNKTDNKKEKATSLDSVIFEYTDNEKLQAALRDFLKLRKAIKAPMTDRALQLATKTLDKLATTDEAKIAIINQSIERGWRGLFPLKDTDTPKAPEPEIDQRFNIVCEAIE